MGERGTARPGAPSAAFKEISTDSTTKEERKNQHQLSLNHRLQERGSPCPGSAGREVEKGSSCNEFKSVFSSKRTWERQCIGSFFSFSPL